MGIIYAILILGAGYYLYQWYDSREETAQRSFADEIVHESAKWLSPHVGLTDDEAEDALHGLLARGEANPSLDPLIRIEYDVVKESSDRALRLIRITLHALPEAKVGEVSRRMGWSSLPEAVRDRFLLHGGDRQTFVLYERG